MSSRLDQLVKGAPPPNTPLPSSAHRTPSPPLEPQHPDSSEQTQPQGENIPPISSPAAATVSPDPLSTLPSSPPQIYLNLLILETSLRSQYLALRARRRQNTFFLLLLFLWIAYFVYALFLRPREDGRGVGGSVYWVVEMGEKVALMGGVVTGVLIWGTGQWERGVRWPRRWLGVANRGLRGMNAKIVVLRGPWWREMVSVVGFLFPFGHWGGVFGGWNSTSYHYVESSTGAGEKGGKRSRNYHHDDHHHQHHSDPYTSTDNTSIVEEDLSPGGDHIKLLLLPKSFSPAFRENWDEYRSDYWEKENERRAYLRRKLKEQRREHARAHGGWLGWSSGLFRRKAVPAVVSSSSSGSGKRPATPSSHGHGHSHSHSSHYREPSTNTTSTALKRRSTPQQETTHSRNSSRSTTPSHLSDADDSSIANSGGSGGSRPRRGSSAASVSSGGERKRRNKSTSSAGGGGGGSGRAPSPLTRIEPRDR
ncbi:hypothetical protein AJ79_01477 [Helicocarpus griseus UAMH5409]|uniref:Spo7-like protein n=1 Tax=Helicocarpus griseus UAMH5409 TaxID=1447875 RepID=A0A2B7Y711_9EURO|nr:hypothetical protein AJ79_01477 [Helicocarpus griseus UAMH5409]